MNKNKEKTLCEELAEHEEWQSKQDAQSSELDSNALLAKDELLALKIKVSNSSSTDLLAEIPKEEVEAALDEVDYKYFGDYEFSEGQHKAVETLCKIACKLYGLKNPYGG